MSLAFFLAQPNERLSIVGHLDTSAIMIKKMPAAHAKHRTKHKQPTQTTTTQHNKGTARAVGKVKKGETVRHPLSCSADQRTTCFGQRGSSIKVRESGQ